MEVQGDFNLLFRAGLRKDFRDDYQEFETIWDQFLRNGNMDGPEIEGTIMAGLNRLYERGDGEPLKYDDPAMGPKVVGVDKEFAAGFQLTRRTVEDDKYNKANQGAKWLAHAARMTYEYRGAEFLDDAFTGDTFRAIDGEPFCSTEHRLLRSPVLVSNEVDPPIELSLTGLTAALDLFQNIKDENGDPMVMMPDTLVIGNNAIDVNTAIAIWNSNLEPFSPDNTDNVLRRRLKNIKIVNAIYKISKKSWFLQASRWNDAWLLVRRAVEFKDTFDFETDVAKYAASTRFLVWGVDWRGRVGSDAV